MSKNLSKDFKILNLPDKTPEQVRKEIYDPSRKYNDEMAPNAFSYLSQGKSKLQLAVLLGVSTTCIDKWTKSYPEFAEAVSLGLEEGEAYWESWYQDKLLKGERIDAVPTIFYFCNRFKKSYTQKNDSSSVNIQINNQGLNLTPEERQVRIKELQDRLKDE